MPLSSTPIPDWVQQGRRDMKICMTHHHRQIVMALRQQSFAEYSCHPGFQQISVYTKIWKQVTLDKNESTPPNQRAESNLLIKEPKDPHHLPSTPIYWKKWPKSKGISYSWLLSMFPAEQWVEFCVARTSVCGSTQLQPEQKASDCLLDISLRNTMLSSKWLPVMSGTLALNFGGFHPGKCKYHQSCKNGLRQQD